MNEGILKLKIAADHAKQSFAFGEIEYEYVVAKSLPYIEAVNIRGKEIAKEHKMPFQPLTVTKYLRMSL